MHRLTWDKIPHKKEWYQIEHEIRPILARFLLDKDFEAMADYWETTAKAIVERATR